MGGGGELYEALFDKFLLMLCLRFIIPGDGDRFFYENPWYYSEDEILAFKSTSFATILERNTGLIELPAKVFLTNEGKNTGNPRSTQCTI